MGPVEIANFITVYETVRRNQRPGCPTIMEIKDRVGEAPFLGMLAAKLIRIVPSKMWLAEDHVGVTDDGVALMLRIESFTDSLKDSCQDVMEHL
jgi:hypothetical protein